MNLTTEDLAWFILSGAVLILMLLSPFLHRAWKRDRSTGSGAAGSDYLALTGSSLKDMVERGLLTPEEADAVKKKSRERMKAELEKSLRAEKAAKLPPGAKPALDPIAAAIAEANRPRTEPSSPPAEKPPEPPPLPDRLRPLAGKLPHELDELRQAGFLTDEDIALLRSRS